MEIEKVGVVSWVEVKRHSRILYVRLSDLDVGLYKIKPGDKLKIEIHNIKRGPRENDVEKKRVEEED